jgi:hypothetical protein
VSAAARRAAILAVVLAAGACCLVAAPGAARADGDPASDTLITRTQFYPYYIKLPPASTKALTQTIKAAKAKGYPIRVALIGHDYDLGSAGVLFRHPKDYAKFLAQELASFNSDWLLVVMPNGYGIYHCVPKKRPGGYSDPCESGRPTAADERALAALPTPAGGKLDLAAAANGAIRRLAALHGASLDGGGALPKLLAGAVALAVLGGAIALFRRSRRATARVIDAAAASPDSPPSPT